MSVLSFSAVVMSDISTWLCLSLELMWSSLLSFVGILGISCSDYWPLVSSVSDCLERSIVEFHVFDGDMYVFPSTGPGGFIPGLKK